MSAVACYLSTGMDDNRSWYITLRWICIQTLPIVHSRTYENKALADYSIWAIYTKCTFLYTLIWLKSLMCMLYNYQRLLLLAHADLSRMKWEVTSISQPFQTKLGSKQHEKVLQRNASSDWTAANGLECRCQYSPLWSGHANQWFHESFMHMHMELTLQGYNHCENLQIIVWTPSVFQELA